MKVVRMVPGTRDGGLRLRSSRSNECIGNDERETGMNRYGIGTHRRLHGRGNGLGIGAYRVYGFGMGYQIALYRFSGRVGEPAFYC
jgi:hypothetical protein